MSIGARLYNLRVNSDLTIADLTKKFDVSRNTIYRWEHNVFAPRRSVLVKLAEFYGVSVDWILKGIVIEENPLEIKLNVSNPRPGSFPVEANALFHEMGGYGEPGDDTEMFETSDETAFGEDVHAEQRHLMALFGMLSKGRQGRLLGYLDALCSEELYEKRQDKL